jgi:O-antigen ligase
VFLAAAAASLLASPVPRAGRVGLLLLPACLVLPALVERLWREERARVIGGRTLALVAGAVAAWSLFTWLRGETPRPALPLGHHGLLAAWLVTLLPLALLPALERSRWRWLGAAGGALALAALPASRSLWALLAVAFQASLWLLWSWEANRRAVPGRPAGHGPAETALHLRSGSLARLGLALVIALALIAALPRFAQVLRGGDPSARARGTYAAAAWEGFLARPLLGWGPGSTPWTAARFLDPLPGVNPAGEAVGELHSLPLQLLYELGLAGTLTAAALVALFLVRRWQELRSAGSALAGAGLLGLAGAGVCALGSAAVAVTALPVAAAIAAGAALAGTAAATGGNRGARGELGRKAVGRGQAHMDRRPFENRVPASAPAVFSLLALGLLFPLDLAQFHYDRALAPPVNATLPASPVSRSAALQNLRAELLQAVRWDPAFPLYRARLASHHARSPGARAAAAAEALRSARAADAVAPLWIEAGALGSAGGAPASWVGEALRRACDLGPLEPLPSFYLSLLAPGDPRAPVRAARALLAEPRLAAAVAWERQPALFAAAVHEVQLWRGVDPGWRESFARAMPRPEERRGAVAWLEYGREGAEAPFSLYLFRRRPWPAPLVRVPLRAALLPRLALPSATALSTTDPEAFTASDCVGGGERNRSSKSSPPISTEAAENSRREGRPRSAKLR